MSTDSSRNAISCSQKGLACLPATQQIISAFVLQRDNDGTHFACMWYSTVSAPSGKNSVASFWSSGVSALQRQQTGRDLSGHWLRNSLMRWRVSVSASNRFLAWDVSAPTGRYLMQLARSWSSIHATFSSDFFNLRGRNEKAGLGKGQERRTYGTKVRRAFTSR